MREEPDLRAAMPDSMERVSKITSEDLISDYGEMITPKELAKYLGIDPRTLMKYAHQWGGVEIVPGQYRFFYKDVKERLNNARINNEKRQEEMACKHHGKREDIPEALPGRDKKIGTASDSLGKRDTRRGRAKPDPHGLLDDNGMGK